MAGDPAREGRAGGHRQESPRTTSPLERAIKEYRRRTRSLPACLPVGRDGSGSSKGAGNFLRAWLVKENARWAGQDWLESLVA